jgi:hypothetical protein
VAVGVVTPARWGAAGGVLDDDQSIDPAQKHHVDVDEVDRQNPTGLVRH